MPELGTVKLGKSELRLPGIGFGTAPIGGMYSATPEEVAIEAIQTAFRQGINYFDTAPFYGSGLSETILGKGLAGIPRRDFIVSTKVGRLIQPDGTPVFNYSRDGVLRSLESSLKRLQLDYVDILLIHDPDDYYEQAIGEAFPTLADLRSQGVIKAIGCGMNQWQMLQKFAQEGDFDCFLLAGRYTLLEQEAQKTFLPLCQEKNIGIIVGGVFNSGLLASSLEQSAKYNYQDAPPEIVARAKKLEEICLSHNVPLRVAALQFPAFNPAVTTRLLGMRSIQEVEENLAALQVSIPVSLWQDLKAQGLLEPDIPVGQE